MLNILQKRLKKKILTPSEELIQIFKCLSTLILRMINEDKFLIKMSLLNIIIHQDNFVLLDFSNCIESYDDKEY